MIFQNLNIQIKNKLYNKEKSSTTIPFGGEIPH